MSFRTQKSSCNVHEEKAVHDPIPKHFLHSYMLKSNRAERPRQQAEHQDQGNEGDKKTLGSRRVQGSLDTVPLNKHNLLTTRGAAARKGRRCTFHVSLTIPFT